MPKLRVIVLDVGWGDSILIESEDDQGKTHFAMVDSNDTSKNRFTLNFIKRRLQTLGIRRNNNSPPLFDFILLSHGHTDHGQGLKSIIQEFGTKHFWYPKSLNWSSMGVLLNYARRSSKVEKHQAVSSDYALPPLGNVAIDVLWPIHNNPIEDEENNNSIVMTLTLGGKVFLLTGDAEGEVWQKIASAVPKSTIFFKVPHHGSVNGSLIGGDPAWINECPVDAELGISCHVGRFGHPHKAVTDLFDSEKRSYLRTDYHYHLIYETDGTNISKSYHH